MPNINYFIMEDFMPVIEIRGNSKEIFNNKDLYIVDFYASWCNPCKILLPTIEEVGRKENITIYKCNIDDNTELTKNFHIMSVPTLVFVKYGKELKRLSGIHSKDDILTEYYSLRDSEL